MLNYKTYQQLKDGKKVTSSVTLALRNFNTEMINMLDTEYNKEITKNYDSATIARRYNIWDILVENMSLLIEDCMLGKVEKLYLIKVINLLQERQIIQGGLEYYCLRNIIRLSVFRTNTSIGWIVSVIADRLQKLNSNNTAIRQFNNFRKNVRKIELVKSLSLTPVIYRVQWVNIFQCYTLGDRVLYEVLNQTDIIDSLKLCMPNEIQQTSGAIPNVDELIDVESDIDTDILNSNSVILDTVDDIIGTTTSLTNDKSYGLLDETPDIQDINDIDISPVQSDNDDTININEDTADYMIHEPDDWY